MIAKSAIEYQPRSRENERFDNSPSCCGADMFSTGRSRSAMFAAEISHLAVGAQK